MTNPSDDPQVTEARKLNLQMIKRVYCSDRCPYVYECPLVGEAHLEDNLVEGDAVCQMGKRSSDEQIRFLRLKRSGETGILDEIGDVLWRVGQIVKEYPTREGLIDYAGGLTRYHKLRYGNKPAEKEAKDESLDITITSSAPKVRTFPIKNIGKVAPHIEMVQIEDPESLFYSPPDEVGSGEDDCNDPDR